jgi:amidase/6-aminohexanoate-cyclic-dimer hydrolase
MPLTDTDLLDHDATGLAALVRAGEVTPDELLDHALARVATHDADVNAIVRIDEAAARAAIRAGLPDGPFTGVPFLLKDVGPVEAGKPLTFGSRFFEGFKGAVDATIVERYRAAGLVTFGRTASPELGLCPATEPAATGPVRSPWRLDRQVGGSSGGAAAAVAARYVTLAQGGDGGGSIRLPAAHSGVYGLKPTRARTPYGPALGEGWGGFVCTHVLSLSVRDSATILDATHGPAPGDPYAAPPPETSYLDAIARPPERLRVGLITASASGLPAHPEVAAAVMSTAALLEDMGHAVEPAALPFDEGVAWADLWSIIAAGAAAAVAARAQALGRAPREDELEPITGAFVERARTMTAEAYVRATQRCHAFGRTMAGVFQRFDVLLSPVFTDPPGPIGTFSMGQASVETYMEECRTGMPYTWWCNIAGAPAASLPLGWSSEGTPIGVQVAAAYGRDDLVLALSAALERARPWIGRVPAFDAGA